MEFKTPGNLFHAAREVSAPQHSVARTQGCGAAPLQWGEAGWHEAVGLRGSVERCYLCCRGQMRTRAALARTDKPPQPDNPPKQP